MPTSPPEPLHRPDPRSISHAAPSGRRPSPHLEWVCLDTPGDPQVRLWHSPERWGQVPASAMAHDDELGVRRLVERCGLFPSVRETPGRVLLLGSNPLAALIAERLVTHTEHHVRLSVPPPLVNRVARRAAISWQAGLAAGVHRDRVSLVRAEPSDLWRPGELVVVVSETIEVDRVMLARLSRRGIPHVVVAAHRDRASVGPWVDIDSPACLSCLDHWRSRDDRDYPDVLARLSRRSAVVEGATADWAASTLITHLCRPDAGRSALIGRQVVNDLADICGPRSLIVEHHLQCRAHQTPMALEIPCRLAAAG